MKCLSKLSAIALIGTSLAAATVAEAKGPGMYSPFAQKAEPSKPNVPVETYGRNDSRAVVGPAATGNFAPVVATQTFGRQDNRAVIQNRSVLQDSMPSRGNNDMLPARHGAQPASED